MTGPKNTSLVGLIVGLCVLVSCNVSEACWRWKCCGAGYSYTYPCPPAVGAMASPAASAVADPTAATRAVADPANFTGAIRLCPPDMVPAFCDVDSGLWRQTTYDRAVGCIHYTLVNTPCPGADKKGPKDKDSEMKGKEGAEGGRDPLVPVVCDRETHKFRRPNPGEQPDAYLPARYLGRPCHLPKR